MSEKEARKPTDWERIEKDHRAGVLSLREIAAANGVSHVAISKRAKKFGWERDLSAKIHAKAEALVNRQEVSSSVTSEQKALTDKAVIDANAEVITGIRMGHRRHIGRSHALCMTLLEELEATTGSLGLLEELETAIAAEDEDAASKRLSVLNKVISLPSRIDSMKKLADTQKTLVGLEREAYGLVNKDEGDTGEVVVEVVRFGDSHPAA